MSSINPWLEKTQDSRGISRTPNGGKNTSQSKWNQGIKECQIKHFSLDGKASNQVGHSPLSKSWADNFFFYVSI